MSDLAFLSTYYPFIPPADATSRTLKMLGCVKDINIMAVLAAGDAPDTDTSGEMWSATLSSMTFTSGLVTEIHIAIDASGAYSFLDGDSTRVPVLDMSLDIAYIGSDAYPVASYALCSGAPEDMDGESFTWTPDEGQIIRVHPDSVMFVQQAPRISLWGLDRPGDPLRRGDSSYAYTRTDRCEIDENGVDMPEPYMLSKGMSLSFEDGYNVSVGPTASGVVINAESGAGRGVYAAAINTESLPYDMLSSVASGKTRNSKTRHNKGLISINGISGKVIFPEFDTSASLELADNTLTIRIPSKETT